MYDVVVRGIWNTIACFNTIEEAKEHIVLCDKKDRLNNTYLKDRYCVIDKDFVIVG